MTGQPDPARAARLAKKYGLRRSVEVLAPAGDGEALRAAVFAGANAVYLGLKQFSARRTAGNFDAQQLKEAVAFCHARDVRVHAAVNTTAFSGELGLLADTIRMAAGAGVDALIVQDLATAALARQMAPGLALHGSTQLTVHTLSGVRQLAEMGFERAILARELSLAEIAAITKESPIEIEVFVHGALCMSVSGQCYLSSMIGGRSGNRGLCAQPCRLPFFADGGGEYALSLKDLSLADRIGELTRMGVASLKIEGRMKRPEYVAAAVTAVRRAREGEPVDFETLRSVFSRSGFTKGYFDGKIDREMFGRRQKEDVTSAAGVLGELEKLYAKENPLVPVTMGFTAGAGEAVALTVRDRDGYAVTVTGEATLLAEKKPTDADRARQNLAKTGGTPYYAEVIDCTIGPGLLVPASALNALRREALEELTARRSAVEPHPFTDRVPRLADAPADRRKPKLRARVSAGQLTRRLAGYCDEFQVPLEEAEDVLASGFVRADQVIVEIPRILFDGAPKALELLRWAGELGVRRAWCGNLGAVTLAREAGLLPEGGYSLNVTNAYALRECARLGLGACELSFELDLGEARRLDGGLAKGILAYGYLPLMALRNCPIQAAKGCRACRGYENLIDRKGVAFTVDCGAHDGRRREVSDLYNSVPLWLADRPEELRGFDFITLYFTRETPGVCERVAAAYAGEPGAYQPEARTRGLYYREVL